MASAPGAQPAANLQLYDVSSGSLVHEFIQRRQQDWCPQWSSDEAICSLSINNEVVFFEKNLFDKSSAKLHLPKLTNYCLTTNTRQPPYHVAVHVPGTKGQPSFVRLFRYPQFEGPAAALANKSFYKAEKAELSWNNKGTAVLIQTSTESSAASYYGEQGLHYVDTSGQSCLVPRAKEGPVYEAVWNPNSESFCVVYGTMPAKATLYNLKCDVIFDFGTGPRNCLYYNPQGNLLCLAGFGNLRGNLELWDLTSQRLLSNPQAPDTTHFAWSPDGVHFSTATTAPRLRVANGFRLWHYSGAELTKWLTNETDELYELLWRPAGEGVFPTPAIVITQAQKTAAAKQQEKPAAYIPPALRNQPQLVQKPKYREAFEPASNVKPSASEPQVMSKAALKNKKKREAKARKKEQEQDAEDDVTEVSEQVQSVNISNK